MKHFARFLAASFSCAVLMSSIVRAADPPKFNSPEIKDGRVTVRTYQPNAKSVILQGEWDGYSKKQMTKGADGVWSFTTDALPSNVYEYGLQVDDVTTLDWKNPEVKGSHNVLLVPGSAPQYFESGSEPKGDVHQHWYASQVTGSARRMHVYMPPGYGKSKRNYPVLYLLHGSGDDDSGWSSFFGRANVILDKLIAEKQAVPMIVVMPMGHIRLPGREIGREEGFDLFEKDLIGDVLPFIEGNYRVISSRKGRALAGLSMGGGQTAVIGLRHPELFSAYGIFSAGIWDKTTVPFTNAIRTLKTAPYSTDVLWIGVGKKDFVYPYAQALRTQLKDNKIPFIYYEDESNHSWPTWRDYLHRFAPLLFRAK